MIVDEVDKFSFFGSDARSETSTIVQIVSVTLREDQLATLPNNLSLCTRKEAVGRVEPRARGMDRGESFGREYSQIRHPDEAMWIG